MPNINIRITEHMEKEVNNIIEKYKKIDPKCKVTKTTIVTLAINHLIADIKKEEKGIEKFEISKEVFNELEEKEKIYKLLSSISGLLYNEKLNQIAKYGKETERLKMLLDMFTELHIASGKEVLKENIDK